MRKETQISAGACERVWCSYYPAQRPIIALLAYSIIRVYFQSILSLDTLAGTETKTNNNQTTTTKTVLASWSWDAFLTRRHREAPMSTFSNRNLYPRAGTGAEEHLFWSRRVVSSACNYNSPVMSAVILPTAHIMSSAENKVENSSTEEEERGKKRKMSLSR